MITQRHLVNRNRDPIAIPLRSVLLIKRKVCNSLMFHKSKYLPIANLASHSGAELEPSFCSATPVSQLVFGFRKSPNDWSEFMMLVLTLLFVDEDQGKKKRKQQRPPSRQRAPPEPKSEPDNSMLFLIVVRSKVRYVYHSSNVWTMNEMYDKYEHYIKCM